jgi:CheY-like chemotaxis protein
MESNKADRPKDNQEEKVFLGRNILVVDDVKINYLLIKAMLIKTGAEIIWADNGMKALEIVSSEPRVDLILMDYNMPEMNGLETTIKIKEMNPNLPVVSQSTFTDSRHFDRTNAPFDAYLTKPIMAENLIQEINKLIQQA